MEDQRPETLKHIYEVKTQIGIVLDVLHLRVLKHDQSKLESPEKEIFDEFTPKLRDTTYGSDEYKQYLSEMKVALDHHYKMNRHHPEHFEHGIRGMTLVDLVEMFCDWRAATKRHADGDIFKSIELNQKRFNYSDDIKAILQNTAKAMMEM